MKKRLASILAITMALTLTACGSSTDSSSSTSSSTTGSESTSSESSQTTTTSSGDKVSITLWHIQTGEMADVIQGSVDRFMEDNPQYEVTVVQKQNDSYKTDLSLAINAGTVPDVFITWGGQTMYDYVDEGLIADLTDYMSVDNYADEFLDAAIAQCTYNDKIVAVPVENISVAGFFYNKEIFDEYGLEVPTTISELEAVCDTLVANGIAPFTLANATKWTGSMYFQYLATRYGGLEPFAEAAAGTGSFENDAFVYAGEKIQEWVNKGYFCEGFNGMDDDSGQARMLFYNGDAAMDLMGSWFISNVTDESTMLEDGTLGYFPFPELEGSDADQTLTLGTLGDNLYSVSSKCADTEGAFKLIQYLLDEQAQTERTAQGKIIPLKNFTSDNEVTNAVLESLNSAGGVQLWYDQYLPSEVAEVHKDTSQEIFGLTMTPEEANAKLQEAMESYLAKNN
jgi:raffinose/stachyose/melibiose transport system substrate-binding protein